LDTQGHTARTNRAGFPRALIEMDCGRAVHRAIDKIKTTIKCIYWQYTTAINRRVALQPSRVAAQIPRTLGSPCLSSTRLVNAQTSASSRSGEPPPDNPSGPKSHSLAKIEKTVLKQEDQFSKGAAVDRLFPPSSGEVCKTDDTPRQLSLFQSPALSADDVRDKLALIDQAAHLMGKRTPRRCGSALAYRRLVARSRHAASDRFLNS
jgi:hypothetical protein